MKKVAGILTVAGATLLSAVSSVHAQASWLPSYFSNNSNQSLNSIIGSVLTLLLFIVVIGAVIYITLAGLKYITSQGEANKAKEAQAAITNAIIGVVVAFIAYFLVTFILDRLGFNPDQFDTVEQTSIEIVVESNKS